MRSPGDRLSAAMVLLTVTAAPTPAATIVVPADQPTIQAAVDAASAGDLVLVEPGSYLETVVLDGRVDITVAGSGPGATDVVGPGNGPVFALTSCAGITLRDMRLSTEIVGGDNGSLGAIRLDDSQDIVVEGNLITRASSNGILVRASDVTVVNNAILDVGDDAVSLRSGLAGPSRAIVINNTFAHLRGGSGIGLWADGEIDEVVAFNNLMWNNDYGLALTVPEALVAHDFNLIAGTTNPWWGTATRAPNELDCDPGLPPAPAQDPHLSAASCAVDVGTDLFAGLAAPPDDFDAESRPTGAGFEIGADEVGCEAGASVGPADTRTCAGSSVTLDASGVVLECAGDTSYEWRDEADMLLGTAVELTVSPAATTSYVVTVTCQGDPDCVARHSVVVVVDEPPLLGPVDVLDGGECSPGLFVSWEPAVFGAEGGVYHVYRSVGLGASCADALSRAPVAFALADTSWWDAGSVVGEEHVYVVEAEDAAVPTTCVPTGPHFGGAVTRSCSSPVVDDDLFAPPEGVWATLRARHEAHRVTFTWQAARGLQPGEHFHLLKATRIPVSTFGHVNGEANTARSHEETDLSERLQFFDLRVANACEVVSEDEFPAGCCVP